MKRSMPVLAGAVALLLAVSGSPAGADRQQASGQIVMAGNTYYKYVGGTTRAKVIAADPAVCGCRVLWTAPPSDRLRYTADGLSADGRFAALHIDGRPGQFRIVALDTRRMTRLNLGPKTVEVVLSARGDRIAYGSGGKTDRRPPRRQQAPGGGENDRVRTAVHPDLLVAERRVDLVRRLDGGRP